MIDYRWFQLIPQLIYIIGCVVFIIVALRMPRQRRWTPQEMKQIDKAYADSTKAVCEASGGLHD